MPLSDSDEASGKSTTFSSEKKSNYTLKQLLKLHQEEALAAKN